MLSLSLRFFWQILLSTFTYGEAMKKLVIGVILGLLVSGMLAYAGPSQWQVAPPTQRASNQWVDISATPVLEERYTITVGYTGMVLEVRNKTNQSVMINWDETFYLMAGVSNGGFTLKGEQGAQHRGFDIIFSGETFVKTIYPITLVTSSDISRLSDIQFDWMHKPMPTGENGIDIKLRVGFEAFSEKLIFVVSE
jgi:hypothetical protein